MQTRIHRSVLALIEGDITKVQADAIVNAANSALIGGGGVDGAIRDKGGPAIDEECEKHRTAGGCPTGKAVMTGAGNLKAKKVIHAVGPVWQGGMSGEAELLAGAYQESLRLAAESGLHSIAFPSISTGAYGYPVELASRIALKTVMEHLQGSTSLELVRFVLFGKETLDVYQKTLISLLPTKRY